MIKVSIIIPVYNAQQYLIECIQSVQKQTIEELELLCVDDGSTDGSLHIMKELQKRDNRIHIFQQPNQGAGAARNLALKNARGEFICFLDADDYFIDQTALEKLYHTAVTQQIKICGGKFYKNLDGEVRFINTYGKLYQNMQEQKKIQYIDYQYDYYFTNYIYSRKFLVENHIEFPKYRRFEDPPFFVKAMFVASKFCMADVPFYCCRSGYKKVNYNNERQMVDIMQGMIDNLEFSLQTGLEKLHRLTYYRMIDICDTVFAKFVQEGNSNLSEKLKQANSMIKWEWLEEKCSINKRVLKPLSVMNERPEGISSDDRNEKNDRWIFPVQCLHPGSQIALYGAGKVGKSFFKQIREREDFSLCAWVDKNFNKILKTDYEVMSPNYLPKIHFDYVVIAVLEITVAMEIMDDLAEMGISPDKIIWSIEVET